MAFSRPRGSPTPLPTPPSSSHAGNSGSKGFEQDVLPNFEQSAISGQLSLSISSVAHALQRVQITDLDNSTSHSWNSHRLPVAFPLIIESLNIQAVNTEHALHSLMVQRLGDYRQAVYVPLMAKPGVQTTEEESLFPLMEKVKDFLAGDGHVMLIMGDSGAGKSTFNRYLEHQLWQDYKPGGPIPLFVNLPALDKPEKKLLKEQLKTLNFSDAQIFELKQGRQFVLICDGYDDSQLTVNLHTKNLLNQPGQWSAKLIITCRTQYLGPDYRDRFVPKAAGHYQRAANDLFEEAVIAPFSRDQIETYVEGYVPLEPRAWVKRDYMDKLTTIPNLMDLAKNPFLLTLCLEALPSVVKGQSDLSKLRVTRVLLYDFFVEHWLGVNKRRLQDQRLSNELLKAFEELKEAGFEQRGIEFQKDLATAIFQEQEGRPVVDYIHIYDKVSWKALFLCSDPESTLLRGASLLSRAGTQYRFIHRSVLEYFYSRSICSPTSNTGEFDPHAYFDFPTLLTSIATHPLSRRSLAAEQSIVQFLSERVQSNLDFKQHLLAIVELSKTDEQAAQAAANAITILVRAGVHFNGVNLRGIRIPGADVSGGQFDSARLQDSDLSGVIFTKSWIRQADFSNARMEEVVLGELPYLKESGNVTACAYSPDGSMFAVGRSDGIINIYDTSSWTKLHSVCMSAMYLITSLAFSPTRSHLLMRNILETALVWNYETGVADIGLAPVTAVAFSPCGKYVVATEYDRTVNLRDVQTGDVCSTWKGNATWPTWVIFSPDSQHIATGSRYEPALIFDTHAGHKELVLESQLGGVACAVYSPDGQWIVTGHVGGDLQQWRTATGTAGTTWRAHPTSVNEVDFSPNGQWIVSCSNERLVRLWDARTGAAISVFAGHFENVSTVIFSPDGSHLASGSYDGTVRLWDVRSSRAGPDSHGSSDPISVVAYSPTGQHLHSDSHIGTVHQHDTTSGELGKILSIGHRQTDCIAYSPDGLRFATVDSSGHLTIHDTGTGAAEVHLGGDMSNIKAMAFSSRWVATSNSDKAVRLWDASSGEPGRVLAGHKRRITSLTFSPNGEHIVSASYDGTIRVWTVDTGEYKVLAGETFNRANVVAYSADGSFIVATSISMYQAVRFWDSNTGEELDLPLKNRDQIACIGFSPCGQWIATGCRRLVHVWRSSLGIVHSSSRWGEVFTIGGFFGEVSSIAWRPAATSGGLEFATGCEDGSVRTWRLREVSGNWSAQLIWSVGPVSLAVRDAVFVGVHGLSPTNRKLLLQRGAKEDEPPAHLSALVTVDETAPADYDGSRFLELDGLGQEKEKPE